MRGRGSQIASRRTNGGISVKRVLAMGRCADERLLRFVSSNGGRSGLSRPMEAVSKVAEHGVVWLGLGTLFALVDRARRGAWVVAAATGPASIILNFCFKSVVRRSRPDGRVGSSASSRRTSFSFPSAHATSSFAAATVVGRIEPRFWRPALLLASCIAYSRLYLARHYPADVVAGGCLGIGVGTLVARKISMIPRGTA
jgi:membrane-associated phospholipid phosphatase